MFQYFDRLGHEVVDMDDSFGATMKSPTSVGNIAAIKMRKENPWIVGLGIYHDNGNQQDVSISLILNGDFLNSISTNPRVQPSPFMDFSVVVNQPEFITPLMQPIPVRVNDIVALQVKNKGVQVETYTFSGRIMIMYTDPKMEILQAKREINVPAYS